MLLLQRKPKKLPDERNFVKFIFFHFDGWFPDDRVIVLVKCLSINVKFRVLISVER